MKLKSYFADTVEAAMSQASRELGDDALLVYSREAHPEARYLGAYEVVFALSPATAAGPPGALAEAPPPVLGSGLPPRSDREIAHERFSRELELLRRKVDRLASAASAGPAFGAESRGALAEVTDGLVLAGLAPGIVREVALRIRDRSGCTVTEAPREALAGLVREELAGMFAVDARIGRSFGGPQAVALVGPPGAGKTSALVKIAARYGLRGRTPAQLISLDSYRVGAAEQLRSFAAILGVGFQAFDTPGALAQSLEEHRGKDLVLIDTPGYGERDLDAAEDLAAFFRSHQAIDVQLTLSASTKTADLKIAVDRFLRFRPTKLLFTKLDETLSAGTVCSEAIRTGLPVSFLTNGQQIPEDLLEASVQELLDLLVVDQRQNQQAPFAERNCLQLAQNPPRGEHAADRAAAA